MLTIHVPYVLHVRVHGSGWTKSEHTVPTLKKQRGRLAGPRLKWSIKKRTDPPGFTITIYFWSTTPPPAPLLSCCELIGLWLIRPSHPPATARPKHTPTLPHLSGLQSTTQLKKLHVKKVAFISLIPEEICWRSAARIAAPYQVLYNVLYMLFTNTRKLRCRVEVGRI